MHKALGRFREKAARRREALIRRRYISFNPSKRVHAQTLGTQHTNQEEVAAKEAELAANDAPEDPEMASARCVQWLVFVVR